VLAPRKCITSTTLPLTHAVLIVGYGIEDGLHYWLIKNSWGEATSAAGYFKLARNANNMCGVATIPSYPVLFEESYQASGSDYGKQRGCGVLGVGLVVVQIVLFIF